MISKIKTALKTIVKTATGVTDDYVYLTAKDENAYKIQPWASILTQSGVVAHIEKKEENLVGVFRIRKYEVTLPIMLAVAGESESQVTAWEQLILKALPPYFVGTDSTGQFFARVKVEQIQHSDFSSKIKENYQAIIRLVINYGVYVSEADYVASPVILP
jgi:hypothetical protein